MEKSLSFGSRVLISSLPFAIFFVVVQVFYPFVRFSFLFIKWDNNNYLPGGFVGSRMMMIITITYCTFSVSKWPKKYIVFVIILLVVVYETILGIKKSFIWSWVLLGMRIFDKLDILGLHQLCYLNWPCEATLIGAFHLNLMVLF